MLLWPHAFSAQAAGIAGRSAPSWNVERWHQLPQGSDSLDVGDFKGKALYIFCFQSWCPGCNSKGFPLLKRMVERYEADPRVAFVAIQTVFEGANVNTFAKAREKTASFGLTIPVGHTEGRNGSPPFMVDYRTGGTPWTVIVDQAGIVRFNDFHTTEDAAVKLIDTLLAADPSGR
jgi:thiol-disulfide isomerase/thioredoxin